MAKKQTRKSISIRGATYDNLREVCVGRSESMSDFTETAIAERLEKLRLASAPPPVVTRPPAVAVPAPKSIQRPVVLPQLQPVVVAPPVAPPIPTAPVAPPVNVAPVVLPAAVVAPQRAKAPSSGVVMPERHGGTYVLS